MRPLPTILILTDPFFSSNVGQAFLYQITITGSSPEQEVDPEIAYVSSSDHEPPDLDEVLQACRLQVCDTPRLRVKYLRPASKYDDLAALDRLWLDLRIRLEKSNPTDLKDPYLRRLAAKIRSGTLRF